MSKIKFIAFALLMSSYSFSQAVLEKSYFIPQDEGGDQTYFFNTETASYHYIYDSGNTLTIYNESHNVFASINLPIESGYILNNIQLFTDKLFNSDNLIEFIVVTRNATNLQLYKMILVNQNGDILQEFGDKSDALVVKTATNNYKLITQKGSYVSGNSFTDKDVYGVSGTLSTNQINLLSKNVSVYPNPAKNTINISNTLNKNENAILKVYSIDGKEVLQKNISGNNENSISLDVSALSSGIYIYKINNYSNKFIKE